MLGHALILSALTNDLSQALRLGQGLDEVTKMELAAVLTPVVVLPSHDLCRAGDHADCLWLLQDGALSCSLSNPINTPTFTYTFVVIGCTTATRDGTHKGY